MLVRGENKEKNRGAKMERLTGFAQILRRSVVAHSSRYGPVTTPHANIVALLHSCILMIVGPRLQRIMIESFFHSWYIFVVDITL